MKNTRREGKSPQGGTLFSRKTILVLATISAVGVAFFVFQEAVLRIAGYEENLCDDSAQRVEISGKVIDKETLEPLMGAKVGIYGSEAHCLTDDRGCFSLTFPAGSDMGEALISVEKDDYNSLRMKPAEYSDSEGAELEICLSRQTSTDGPE